MKRYNTGNRWFLLLMLMPLLQACGGAPVPQADSRVEALPYYRDASFTPHWFAADSDSLRHFHSISPFQLTNQDGQPVTEATFKDKIYITDFFFTTCPGICPKMTSNMTLLQEAFLEDDDVLLLSHSVMPSEDSVQALKDYADYYGIVSGKWHLVTGDRSTIYNLGRQDYFVEENLGLEMEADDFLHTENFVLIDTDRRIRGIYNGLNKTAINQLIADVALLKEE